MTRRYLNAAEAVSDAVNARPLAGTYAAVIGWNSKYRYWVVYSPISGSEHDNIEPEILIASDHPKVVYVPLSEAGADVLKSIAREGLLP